jgi:hypothetical protein
MTELSHENFCGSQAEWIGGKSATLTANLPRFGEKAGIESERDAQELRGSRI